MIMYAINAIAFNATSIFLVPWIIILTFAGYTLKNCWNDIISINIDMIS